LPDHGSASMIHLFVGLLRFLPTVQTPLSVRDHKSTRSR
jgi:hypothetical protein